VFLRQFHLFQIYFRYLTSPASSRQAHNYLIPRTDPFTLLHKRGLQVVAREAGNFGLPAYPGLILKESYWRWPERNLASNAIDFCVQVLGLSFHNAMRQITSP